MKRERHVVVEVVTLPQPTKQPVYKVTFFEREMPVGNWPTYADRLVELTENWLIHGKRPQ